MYLAMPESRWLSPLGLVANTAAQFFSKIQQKFIEESGIARELFEVAIALFSDMDPGDGKAEYLPAANKILER